MRSLHGSRPQRRLYAIGSETTGAYIGPLMLYNDTIGSRVE